MVSPKALLAFALLVTTVPAGARTYCCKDDSGRRVCGDILPPQCLSRTYQEFNSQGVMAKQYEGPLTAEQRAQRQAEQARKKEEDRKAADENRRDRALLASYTSVRDIELKRDRMVGDLQGSLRLSEERYSEALERQKKLQAQVKSVGNQPISEMLKLQIRKNEAEVSSHEEAIESKKQDIAAIKEQFERDRQRYLALTQKRQEDPAKPAAPTPPASSSTSR
jgi:hypothetical protein